MGRVDELIRQLETGNIKQRRDAAAALGELGNPKAVPALLQKLDDTDEDRFVRTAAAIALGKLGDLNAVPVLIRAYRRFQEKERYVFLKSIAEILGRTAPDDEKSRAVLSDAVDTLIQAVQDDSADDDVRTAAVEALGETRDPKAIPVLAEQLREDKPASIAETAARALRHFNDPQAIQALIQAATNTNKHIAIAVREAAVKSLGDIGNPNAVDTLIQILEDSSDEYTVRNAAARALGRIGDPKAIEPLIRTLENESENTTDWSIARDTIAEVLGEFQDPRVTDALVKALGTDYFTAQAAAKSLKKLRDRRAVEPLVRILEGDPSDYRNHQRQFAAEILGVLGDPRAIPALAKALRDKNRSISKAARESLPSFILTHPDAILRLPPEDRHILGRLVQETERKKLLQEVCK
jgi:HEAT repeat protein